MCEKAIEEEPYTLRLVPGHFKSKEMCEGVVKKYTCTLQCIPDWFVMQERIDPWGDDDHNNKFFEWYDGYKERKVQKASIKE